MMMGFGRRIGCGKWGCVGVWWITNKGQKCGEEMRRRGWSGNWELECGREWVSGVRNGKSGVLGRGELWLWSDEDCRMAVREWWIRRRGVMRIFIWRAVNGINKWRISTINNFLNLKLFDFIVISQIVLFFVLYPFRFLNALSFSPLPFKRFHLFIFSFYKRLFDVCLFDVLVFLFLFPHPHLLVCN